MTNNDPEHDSNDQPPFWAVWLIFWSGYVLGVLQSAWDDVREWWREH